ncbi:hypothetical protein GCK72_021733 [Caenorhabditis remanei]|uniref:DUF38 domain-containing protein n=1 Tax=Caenorhabditis remanei TaxID=31234 RepID=A0A6A5GKC7_CAERE|nr:hypothetical protein GCK72_021733 [Caenorhabditis remanei]KAF1755164.1 hypothetical protein GCK72_021733 [Caenorhabditis remanei]
MPALVMNRILSGCDIRAIFSLQKVSCDLRDFIGEVIPCIHLTYIQVEVRVHEICLILSNDQENITIRYQHNENGCKVEFNGRKHVLDKENFIEIFAKDLSLILKHQSPKTVLEVFSFQCWDHEDWYERQRGQRSFDCLSVIDNDGAECLMKPLVEQISEEIVEQQVGTITARTLETYGIFPRHTKSILKLFRPGTLKHIKIYDPHRIRIENNKGYTSDEDYSVELDRIYDLEQWKQAEELMSPDLRNLIDDVIPAIHLTRIKIEVDTKAMCLTIANNQENIKINYQKSTAKTLANDLELFIKFQKSEPLKIVKLEWRDTDYKQDSPLDKELMLEMECNERQSVMDPLVEALSKISGSVLNVKIVETLGVFPWEVKPLLKLCRPGALNTIRLCSPHRSKFVTFDCSDDPEDYSVDLDEIQELEQWKQAKELNMLGFCVPPQVSVGSYAHFLKGVVFVRKLTADDIFYLSQTFVESPNFEFFTITIPRCKNYLSEVDWVTELNKKFGITAEIPKDPDNSNNYDWVLRSPRRALQLRYCTPNTFNFTVKVE